MSRPSVGFCAATRAALVVAGLALPGRAAEVVVGMDKEVFGNPEAAELVQQARSFDPARSRTVDCYKAMEFYAKAIALQPGAKINAALCHRIAQIHAYRLGVRAPAIVWWRRCLKETNPHQTIWIEAQMGLGSTTFLEEKCDEAVAAYEAVLAVDTEKMELPDWQARPEPTTDTARRSREAELAVVRKMAEESRLKAVELTHYVMMLRDRKAAASTLARIAKRYEGTPVGKRAAELAVDALKRTSQKL
jgi:hypothetical protein